MSKIENHISRKFSSHLKKIEDMQIPFSVTLTNCLKFEAKKFESFLVRFAEQAVRNSRFRGLHIL